MAKKARSPLSRSLRVYQRAAVIFVILSFLLLVAVLYLSVSQATIKVYPVPQLVSTTFELDIVPSATKEGEVTGYIVQEDFSKSKTFSLPEAGATAVEAKATGFVTIKNETNTDQPLVRTTRVLSEEGVLFRLEEAVTVPKQGEVLARVIADAPGLSGENEASTFTIPGLNTIKQKSIYAVSDSKMTGGLQYVRTLTEEDIIQALDILKDEMLDDIRTSISVGIDTDIFDGEGFDVEIITYESDTEIGTETGVFSLSANANITGAYYPREAIALYASDQLAEIIGEGFELVTTNIEGVQISLSAIDIEAESAIVTVYIDGQSILALDNDLLDRSRFAGQSPQQVESLLDVPDLIEESHVNFQPFWLKRVPTLKDHVKINIVTRGL